MSRLLLLLPILGSISNTDDFDQFSKTLKKLQDKLFKSYDSQISPYSTRYSNFSWNTNGSYSSITLLRSRLLSVQEREQSFSTATGVILGWTDRRLAWNPDQYSGIEHLYVRRGKVWMPEIVPCESTGVEPVTLFDTSNVKIYSSGEVIMLAYFFATHNCEIKADNFPFDINHCMMCFALFGTYDDELMLRGGIVPKPDLFGTGEFDYDLFLPKPMMNMGLAASGLSASSVLFHFVITRQPQFWVSLIILPTFFIGMLVLIGIFYGEESESLNGLVELGLSGMMSLTVIVGILNDSIAKSKDLSALGRFVLYDIIIVVVAVMVVITAIKQRRRLVKIADAKLKKDSANPFWLRIKRYSKSTKITRYVLFFIFFALHLANLISMLTACSQNICAESRRAKERLRDDERQFEPSRG
ncbi:hypothetical protein PRIPAC_71299, partial [Pristionchus pacificus]